MNSKLVFSAVLATSLTLHATPIFDTITSGGQIFSPTHNVSYIGAFGEHNAPKAGTFVLVGLGLGLMGLGVGLSSTSQRRN